MAINWKAKAIKWQKAFHALEGDLRGRKSKRKTTKRKPKKKSIHARKTRRKSQLSLF